MYREVLYADLAGALIGDVQGGIVCRFSRSINRRCTGMYCMPISPNAPTFWCRSKNLQRRNRGKRQLTEVPITVVFVAVVYSNLIELPEIE